MVIAFGTFVGGKIILDHVLWDEGTCVTVIATEYRVDHLKYLSTVQLATGEVTADEVTVPGASLMEGAFVAVLATDLYARGLSEKQRAILTMSVAEGGASPEVMRGRLAARE